MRAYKLYILIFLFIISLSVESTALEISMKKVYSPGETIIAEIRGPIFDPILLEDVEFKRENVRVPLEYDLKKFGDNYFIWAGAPKSPGNYTFLMKDVATTINGKEEKIDFAYNFSVSGEMIEYSVVPGFILTSQDIEIDITLNRDLDKNISLGDDNLQIFLQPGDNKIKILFRDLVNYDDKRFKVGAYLLPVKLIDNDFKEIVIKKGLVISPSVISERGSLDVRSNYTLSVRNSEDKEIKNIHFTYDESKFRILPKGNFSLNPNQTRYYNLTILNISNLKDYEEIYARSNASYARLLVNINIVANSELNDSDLNSSSINKTNKELRCSEIRGGRFCSAGQVCSGQSVSSLDGSCCIGACNIKKKSGSNSWLGYILGLILVGILGYVYYNYQKTKKNKGDSFKKKVDAAEKKLP
ncbi:MAG: hypothetical protein Q8Q31_01915 [Nanoarchaeota archaeon]|nr:hypothetical protein [Nanoarchaeota archaeon]